MMRWIVFAALICIGPALPMKDPDLFWAAIRLTRSRAGRKSHWSSCPVSCVCVRRIVPLTSAGLSKMHRLLVVPPSLSNMRTRIWRSLVWPCLLHRTMRRLAVQSPYPP